MCSTSRRQVKKVFQGGMNNELCQTPLLMSWKKIEIWAMGPLSLEVKGSLCDMTRGKSVSDHMNGSLVSSQAD